jgi:integrase/recombinase XerD
MFLLQEELMRTNRRLAQLWLDALATELGASAGTIDT